MLYYIALARKFRVTALKISLHVRSRAAREAPQQTTPKKSCLVVDPTSASYMVLVVSACTISERVKIKVLSTWLGSKDNWKSPWYNRVQTVENLEKRWFYLV